VETRLNVTGIDPAVYSSQLGYGNQLIACGILLRLGYEVSLAETGNSFYDLLLILKDGSTSYPIKTGVRTMRKSLSFTVNSGGGKNRARPTGIGSQIPSIDDVQLWVGITKDFDLYYMPHILIVNKQRMHSGSLKPVASLSSNYLNHTKNNIEILENFFNDAWLRTNVLNKIHGSSSWV